MLDAAGMEPVERAFFKLLEKPRRIVMDFASVENMSSAALGRLIMLEKRAKSAGARLELRNFRPIVADIFRAAGFDGPSPS